MRSLALDLNQAEGRVLLGQLLEQADFLIESADLAQRQACGLDVDGIRRRYPELINVSIMAVGREGPKAGYALIIWADGGQLLPSRDGDRPPLHMSIGQSWSSAAGGALLAHHARLRRKRGLHVDVSVQQCDLRGGVF